MGENFGALIALGVGFRILAYIFMHLISTPKRPKLNEKKAIKAWINWIVINWDYYYQHDQSINQF